MKYSGYILVLSAVLLWSLSIPLSGKLAGEMGPYAAGSLVYLVGGTLGATTVLWKKGRVGFQSGSWFWTAIRGLLFVGYCFGLYVAVGLVRTPASLALVSAVNYQWPILCIVAATGLRRISVRWWMLAFAVFGGSLGIVLVRYGAVDGDLDSGAQWSLVIAAFAAGLWAMYSVFSENSRDGTGMVFPFMLSVGVVLLIVQYARNGECGWGSLPRQYIPFVMVPGAAYLLWENGVRRIGAYRAGVIALSIPIFSVMALSIVYRTELSHVVWLGMLVIALAAASARYARIS